MTTRLSIASSIFLVIAMMLPCTTASAQLRGVVKACVSDVKAQCPGVKPGEGRIRACVKTHLKDLSEPCRNVVLKAVTVKACAADVKKVCADTKPGRGRVKACMKDHLADVSTPCQEALANAAAGKE
jgi:Cysteine rich repeat